ncbi:hypothetical protein ACFLWA_02920 [Chloroflexota bacterium]
MLKKPTMHDTIAHLEAGLNDFDLDVRKKSLSELVSLADSGQIALEPASELFNMHCHSFFSFNAYGHSPSSLAWLGRCRGYKLMGIIDFDSLDGVDEFLDACDIVGIRGSAGLETRVFVPDFAALEINSPGEPGVCYHLGIGFATSRVPLPVVGELAGLKERAAQRNLGILNRVNEYLAPVTIDYEKDVLPLAPEGKPTERHMVLAFAQAAEQTVADPTVFWATKLGLSEPETATLMTDPAGFQNALRSKLMKRGGVGYVPPDSGMFPSLDSLNELIVACGALPCVGWLDGTSPAEARIDEWLNYLIDRGAVTLNIVPDRNWNVADPQTRRLKIEKLYQVVELAGQLHLPLNIGTEMNSFGQKLVDDLGTAELAPLRRAFQDGAYFVYGHTALQRASMLGYQSAWANAHFPSRSERNAFYTEIGYLVPPGRESAALLSQVGENHTPEEIISTFRRQSNGGKLAHAR